MMRKARLAALIAAGLMSTVSAPALAAGLSPAEAVMVRTVEAEQGRTIDLLEKLVNVNSGTMNLAGVEAVRLDHDICAHGEVMRHVVVECKSVQGWAQTRNHDVNLPNTDYLHFLRDL